MREKIAPAAGGDLELLVVYDMDEDTTLPVLRKIAADQPFKIREIKNAAGRGVVGAIRTGFREAHGEAVLVIMADLSDDLAAVGPMLAKFREGCDVVCGSRYMPGGKQVGGPWLKGTLSKTAGLSLHWLLRFPTHDVTNSFKLYRRAFLDSVQIESDGGFEIGLEMLVKAFAAGRKIGEVPSVWTDRVAGESRFRLWKWLPRYLRWYAFAFTHRPRKPAV